MIKSFSSFVFFILATATLLVAQPKVPDRPNPPRLVNDFAGMFTPDEINRLETEVDAYSDSSSNQIAVVTVKDLGDYAIEDWALEIGRKWGIGAKQKNNGVVILVSQNPRKINISPGYGLEGALPDLICKRIEVQQIVPAFKENRYFDGIHDAITAIRARVKGEFVNENLGKDANSSDLGFWLFIIFLVIMVVVFMYISNRSRYAQYGSSNRGLSSGPGFIWFGGGGGGNNSGGWGGGGGGGGDSGGFGGFGGGSFGGGGASSDW